MYIRTLNNNNNGYIKVFKLSFMYNPQTENINSSCSFDFKIANSGDVYKEFKDISFTHNFKIFVKSLNDIECNVFYNSNDLLNKNNNGDYTIDETLIKITKKVNQINNGINNLGCLDLDIYIKNDKKVKLAYDLFNFYFNGYVSITRIYDISQYNSLTNQININYINKNLKNRNINIINEDIGITSNSNIHVVTDYCNNIVRINGQCDLKSDYSIGGNLLYVKSLSNKLGVQDLRFVCSVLFSDWSYGVCNIRITTSGTLHVSEILTTGKGIEDVKTIYMSNISYEFD